MARQFQSGECAPGEVIALLAMGRDAAGLMSESESEAWMAHVAGCESCAELLREAVVNAGGLSTERTMGSQPSSGANRARIWIGLAAAIGLFGVGLAWYALRSRNEIPQLLAKAYTTSRPFEWRMPDAGFVRVTRHRGSGQDFGKSAELLAAQATIAGAAARNDRPSVDLLRVRSWAQILDLDPDAAIETLSRLVAQDPKNAELLDLLGVAYGLRGDMASRPEDLVFAVDCFTKVLAVNPKSVRSRFNRALVLMRIHDYAHALDDWKIVIAEEIDAGWRGEAQEQANEAAKKIEEHRKKRSRLKTGPNGFLGDLANGHILSLDLYLERPFLEWLLDSSASEALKRIADLAQRNGEEWPASILRQRPSRPEIEATIEMIDDNRSGRFQKARDYAARAVPTLRSIGQQALADYVETNSLYSSTRLFDPVICKASGSINPPVTPFLRATAFIHLGNCDAIMGDIHEAIAKFELAGKTAAAARHRASEARALDAEIARRLNSGDAFTTIVQAVQLTASYWENGLSSARMNGALFNLAEICSRRGIHAAAYFFMTGSAEAVAQDPDPLRLGAGHAYAARHALKAGLLREALYCIQEGQKLLSHHPPGRDTTFYLTELDFSRAELEIQQSNPQAALAILGSRKSGGTDKNWTEQFHFHRLTAAAEDKIGNTGAALSHVRQSLQAMELILAPLSGTQRTARLESVRPTYLLAARLLLQEGRADEALQSVQALLSPAETRCGVANCLTVARIDGRYQVFASGKSVETWTAASHTRQAGQELLESVQARRDEPTVRSLAMAFSKALLGDRWASLDKSTGVSIAVDAGASALPFGLLTDSTGRYLALQTELSLAIRRPAKAKIPAISRIALAGLQSAMNFRTKRYSNLPEVNGELEDIHGSFPLARMWNRQQRLEDFVRGELAWAQSFHFAGHAVLSGDTNVILLGDGRLLTPGTASTLDWSGISLVTLSACGTASDGMLGYFNPASLVRSFLDRNAESVLATNWAVDSSSNREWMRVFYRVLAQGESIHSAQLSAKKALFANPIHSHPSHWAGYLIYT